MIKKNSQKRFNTAGARIIFSNKLPSDFFMPEVRIKSNNQCYRSCPHKDINQENHIYQLNNNMTFTFYQATKPMKTKRKYGSSLQNKCKSVEKVDKIDKVDKQNNNKSLFPFITSNVLKQKNSNESKRQSKLYKVAKKNKQNNIWKNYIPNQFLCQNSY